MGDSIGDDRCDRSDNSTGVFVSIHSKGDLLAMCGVRVGMVSKNKNKKKL